MGPEQIKVKDAVKLFKTGVEVARKESELVKEPKKDLSYGLELTLTMLSIVLILTKIFYKPKKKEKMK